MTRDERKIEIDALLNSELFKTGAGSGLIWGYHQNENGDAPVALFAINLTPQTRGDGMQTAIVISDVGDISFLAIKFFRPLQLLAMDDYGKYDIDVASMILEKLYGSGAWVGKILTTSISQGYQILKLTDTSYGLAHGGSLLFYIHTNYTAEWVEEHVGNDNLVEMMGESGRTYAVSFNTAAVPHTASLRNGFVMGVVDALDLERSVQTAVMGEPA